jgi:hypothetical protein
VSTDQEPLHWLLRPRTIRGLWIGGSGVLALLVLADFFIHAHAYFGVDGSFGFYAWYGLLTCLAMVLGAKALGVWLKRGDDYYGGDGGRDTGGDAGSDGTREPQGPGHG